LRAAFAARGLSVGLARDHAPETVDYVIFSPKGPLSDFSPYTRCKAVLGLWAGVETIVGNATLTQPLTRMADAGLREGMVEWVTGHVLRYHLGIDAQVAAQTGQWLPVTPPLARNRSVGILGFGTLGAACARALKALNFDVHGWSRRPRTVPGFQTHSGRSGLHDLLTRSEILVLLLPETPETVDILNAETLTRLPRGARIINPGRGPLIDDEALLAALNSGHIAHATLDVFRTEPLPAAHPYWAHPNVTVTPHIASETRPDTAAAFIAENICRSEAGEPLSNLVDRTAGY